jgi:hypothetical protein
MILTKNHLSQPQKSHFSTYYPSPTPCNNPSSNPSSHQPPALKYVQSLLTDFLKFRTKISNYSPSHLLNRLIFCLNHSLFLPLNAPNYLSKCPSLLISLSLSLITPYLSTCLNNFLTPRLNR